MRSRCGLCCNGHYVTVDHMLCRLAVEWYGLLNPITSRQRYDGKSSMLAVLSIFLIKHNAYFMPNAAYQPKSFPQRQFGKEVIVNRSFQTTRSDRFKWLNCDTGNDSVFCFVCCQAVKDGKISFSPKAEECFLFNQPSNRV